MEFNLAQMFVDVKDEFIEKMLEQGETQSYENLLRTGLYLMRNAYEKEHGDAYGFLDVDKIVQLDHGDYQGTLVFIMPEKTYQPNTYYLTKVGYGSCSGCDTLQAIEAYMDYDYDTGKYTVTTRVAGDYYTLTLHMMERMKEV